MEVTQLSKTHNVRRLQDADIERICTLCSGNPQYYRYHPPAVTADSIREDMRALPPGREPRISITSDILPGMARCWP